MAKKNIYIIEIGETVIKAVKCKPGRSGRIISGIALERIYSQEIQRQVSGLFTPKEIRSGDFILVIPRRFVILKLLRLPSVDEAEIAKMIDLQIVNQVPYPKEMILYDYKVVRKNSDGYTQVLIAIIHRDVYLKYRAVCQAAGIMPKVTTFSSVGLLAWITAYASDSNADKQKTTMFLNIEEEHTEICFVRDGKLLFSRQMKLGIRSAAGDPLTAFMDQIHLSVRAFKKEAGDEKIDAVGVISACNIEELAQRLRQDFNDEINLYNPLKTVPSEKSLKLPASLQEGVSVAAALGLALTKQSPYLKFVALVPRKSPGGWLGQTEFVKAVLLTCTAVFMMMLAAGSGYYKDQFYVQALKGKLKSVGPQVELYGRQIQQLQFVRSYLDQQTDVTRLFSEIYKVAPLEVAFRSVSFSADGVVSLQGYSQNRASVNNLQAELVNSRYFQDVNLQYASNIRALNKELTDFKITCQLVK